MDADFGLALVVAVRAFADELERQLVVRPAAPNGSTPVDNEPTRAPAPGSAESMRVLLEGVAEINDAQHRGANDREMRTIAIRAGITLQGTAGYYAAKLLEGRKNDGRWVTETGRQRLRGLQARAA